MEQIEEKINTYQQIIDDSKTKLNITKNKIYRISIVRIILFIAGVTGIIYFFGAGTITIAAIIAITFVPFLASVKYHNQLFYQKEYLEKMIELNKQEIAAFNYDYSSFEDGKEFIDPTHLYSYDLDLFGNKSLFQYINRTSTYSGKPV